MTTADAPLIEVEHVSKAFCRDLKRALWYGLKDISGELVGQRRDRRTLRRDEFWALRDVSFQVRRGECLGLIGRNGAGKTSLLRLLNGLIRPDSGQIAMRGRIGALIALGAGFNPVLTGRENVYINGSVLGLSKREIDGKLDEIIDFAEVREAIDAPVQSYSSGMKVRLGFAVATAMKPDVVLLDEVLAVGDVRFRTKCYHRIGKILKHAAVIYVAHDMNQISRLCDSILLLDRGRVMHHGDVTEGIGRYEEINQEDGFYRVNGEVAVWHDDLTIESIDLQPERIATGEPLRVVMRYHCANDIELGAIICNFKTQSGILVAKYDSSVTGESFTLKRGANVLRVDLGRIRFTSNTYVFSMTGVDPSGKLYCFNAQEHKCLRVDGEMKTTALVQMGPTLEYEHASDRP